MLFFLNANGWVGNSIYLSTHSIDGDIGGVCLTRDIIEIKEYSEVMLFHMYLQFEFFSHYQNISMFTWLNCLVRKQGTGKFCCSNLILRDFLFPNINNQASNNGKAKFCIQKSVFKAMQIKILETELRTYSLFNQN